MADLPRRTSGSERTYGSAIPMAVTLLFILAVAAIFAVWLSRDLEKPGESHGGGSTYSIVDQVAVEFAA